MCSTGVRNASNPPMQGRYKSYNFLGGWAAPRAYHARTRPSSVSKMAEYWNLRHFAGNLLLSSIHNPDYNPPPCFSGHNSSPPFSSHAGRNPAIIPSPSPNFKNYFFFFNFNENQRNFFVQIISPSRNVSTQYNIFMFQYNY